VAERAWKWAKRRPAIAALLGVVLLTALGGLAGVFWQWQKTERANRALDRANQSLDGANRELDRANRSLDATNQRLEGNLYATTIGLASNEMQGKSTGRAVELLESCPEPRRGWEWRHLSGLRFRESLLLRGHHGYVSNLAFSPDGRRIASSGSTDRTARVWDTTTGEELLKIDALDVVCVAFHPDGRRLLTANGGGDQSLKLWDTITGRELRTFRGQLGQPNATFFSPDGRRIISAAWDATIRVWETDTGRLLRTLGEERSGSNPNPNSEGITGAIWLAVHPEGRHVACSYQPNDTVNVWDLETGQVLWTTPGSGAYNQVSYSPDGRFLAVNRLGSSPMGTTVILDAASGRVVTSVPGASPRFLGDSGRIVTSVGSSVNVWDTADGRLLVALRAPGESYGYLGTSPDGRRLAAATIEGEVRLWDTPPEGEETGEEIRLIRGATEPFWAVAFRPGGQQLAAASTDGTALVWDVASGREVLVLRGHDRLLMHLAYSPDGRLLATCGFDKTVRLWDADTGRLLRALPGVDTPPVLSVLFSPDGGRLVVKTLQQILIWDLAAGRWISSAGIGWTFRMAQDAGGRYLVTVRGTGNLLICDAKTCQVIGDVPYDGGNLNRPAFHPDGRCLATAGNDRTITLWETSGWTRVRTLRGHDTAIHSVAFYPDGRWLASGSTDGTVVLWDAASGHIVRTLKGNIGEVFGLAFSPDGRRLATASGIRGRGEVMLWDLARLDLTAEVREQAARDHAEGRRLARLGRTDESLATFQKALDIRQELVRGHPDDPRLGRDLAESYRERALALQAAGRLHEAGRSFQEALAVRQGLARNHPGDARLYAEVADLHQAIANLQAAAGRWPEALTSCRRAAAVLERLVHEQPDDPRWHRELVDNFKDVNYTYWMLIACQHHAGLLAETEQSLHHVLEVLGWLLRYDPQDINCQANVGDAWRLLGELQWTLGRHDEALRCYERARDHWEAVVRQNGNPWRKSTLAWCHALVARGQAEAGRPVEAARSLRRALGLIDEVGEPDPYGLLRSAPALAQASALIDSGRVPLTAAERARGSALADQAVDRLRRALVEWSPERDHEVTYPVLQADYALRFSPSFDALRPRADFQNLLQDADFPTRPFVDDPPDSAP
jgi:WD40 repeat protein